MSWEQKLASIGFTYQTAPPSIKKPLQEYSEFYDAYNGAKEEYQNAEDGEEKEALLEDIETLESALQKQAELIDKKIATYEKNKDQYNKLAEQSRARAKAKKADGSQQKPAVAVPKGVEVKAAASKVVETQATVSTGDGSGEPKKKSSLGWVMFAVLAGVVTLGAVNLMNKE